MSKHKLDYIAIYESKEHAPTTFQVLVGAAVALGAIYAVTLFLFS